jgi:hypothetical protein
MLGAFLYSLPSQKAYQAIVELCKFIIYVILALSSMKRSQKVAFY